MSPIDLVKSRLGPWGLREVAPGRWRARCPAHAGKNPQTLSVAITDSGAVLLQCWHGCEVDRVVDALGLGLADLFPPRGSEGSRFHAPFVPSDVFEVIRFEALIVAAIAASWRHGTSPTPGDFDRLALAQQRLDRIAGACYGRA